jgi:Site-specific DNA methylase
VNYYNENDPKMAAWLRALIADGLIPKGEVDERSIVAVRADDLQGFIQCHFFAGIGGWPYALQLAEWPEDRPVWTGSCPCQPWSHANVQEGGGAGEDDERHLWPDFYRLIRERKPAIIFGEQVPGAIGRGWLDQVFNDFEAEAYACGAALLRANAFGAKHIRKRFFWVADSDCSGRQRHKQVKCLSEPEEAPQPIHGDALARSRTALDGDYGDLLHCNGVSVVMERHALKGYGNAIVPQVAAEFIKAYMSL